MREAGTRCAFTSSRFYSSSLMWKRFFCFPGLCFSDARQGFRLAPLYGLASMFVFLGILIVGYVWLYRKGALEWV